MLRAILNKSWTQDSTKQLLYVHSFPILQTIHLNRRRLPENCWRYKDRLLSDFLKCTLSRGCARVDRPPKIYMQHTHTHKHTHTYRHATCCYLGRCGEVFVQDPFIYNFVNLRAVPTIHVSYCLYIHPPFISNSLYKEICGFEKKKEHTNTFNDIFQLLSIKSNQRTLLKSVEKIPFD